MIPPALPEIDCRAESIASGRFFGLDTAELRFQALVGGRTEMPLFELSVTAITAIEEAEFSALGVLERVELYDGYQRDLKRVVDSLGS